MSIRKPRKQSSLFQFFFGDEPRLLDIKAFTWLSLLLVVDEEVPCPLRDYIKEEAKNLVGHFNRIKVSYKNIRKSLICLFNAKQFQDRSWGDHWDEATGEKLDMNPHIPKPVKEEPKEEEKKEEEKKEEKKDEEEKEKAEEKKEEVRTVS